MRFFPPIGWKGDQSALFYETNARLIYECPNKCGRRYSIKGSVNRHLKYECGKAKQFMCEICYKYFTHKSDMKAHIGVVHRKIYA